MNGETLKHSLEVNKLSGKTKRKKKIDEGFLTIVFLTLLSVCRPTEMKNNNMCYITQWVFRAVERIYTGLKPVTEKH